MTYFSNRASEFVPISQTTFPAVAAYLITASPIYFIYPAVSTINGSLGFASAPTPSIAAIAENIQTPCPQLLLPWPHRFKESALISHVDFSGSQANSGDVRSDEWRSNADENWISPGTSSRSQETSPPIFGGQIQGWNKSNVFPSGQSLACSIASATMSEYHRDSAVSRVSHTSMVEPGLDAGTSRPLPILQGQRAHQVLPAQLSMVSSLASTVLAETQKKHVCKICDKRFARPSALQTHMYSHTGEKRE